MIEWLTPDMSSPVDLRKIRFVITPVAVNRIVKAIRNSVRYYARRGEQDRESYKKQSYISECFDDPVRPDSSRPYDEEKEIDTVGIAGCQIAHNQQKHHGSVK